MKANADIDLHHLLNNELKELLSGQYTAAASQDVQGDLSFLQLRSKGPSSIGLCTYKFRALSTGVKTEMFCHECSIVTFPPELLDEALFFFLKKIYFAAISACHVGFNGVMLTHLLCTF